MFLSLALAGCSPSSGAQPSATAATQPPTTATAAVATAVPSVPPPAASSAPSAVALPAAVPLAPAAVINLPDASDAIPLATDGKDVWIGVDGAIIRVDGTTGAQTRLADPAMRTGNGTLLLDGGSLWVADHGGSQVQRLDPRTGHVELTAPAPAPVNFWRIGGGLYVGSEGDNAVYPLDAKNGRLGAKIPGTFQTTAGLGQFWMGQPDLSSANTVNRVDPLSGKTVASITVPDGSGCGVSGAFPDNIWAGCTSFQVPASGSVVVRIDPTANQVAASTRLPAYGGVIVVGGVPWFLVHRQNADNTVSNSLVAVDPASGKVLSALDLGPLDADVPVVTANALWIPDEQGHRVLHFDLAALHP